ncbi:hypothetical protein HEK616_71820 [Streptomyces nigrescens]|uniref:Major facilitator superfamily (MFS) profile domain-containing protein n=1 Tax=Streptomyces nigrescens TaxID=1920 RepID=A0ABM8A4U6_STRNI|nr:hypothetical protein HEK616_71820 [Streptomyces nigrescens]
MSDVRLRSSQGRWVLLTAVLGSGMAMLDSTVVNVALPRIGQDLHADLAVLQWTVTAYLLTLSALILLGGALGDRYGRRRIFVIGVIWFATASLLCGLAPQAGVLIAARALQGVGGALLTPGSLALIQAVFRPDDRARAVGAWSGLGGVAAAIGPFVGGWLVDGPGWRWVFFVNVPLALVCVPVALRHVPETRERDAAARRGFDVAGAVLGALALAGVTYALIEAPGRGASPGVVVRGGRCAARGGLRPRRGAPGGPDAAARDLPHPPVLRDQRGDGVCLRGVQRLLLPGRPPAPGRRGLLGPPGRRRPAADHRADAPAFRPLR